MVRLAWINSLIMDKRLLFVFVAFVATTKAQYPQDEEDFQSAEPIAIFARSQVRLPRGGGYGSAPVEVLSGPTYSNQQIETLPNYGGGQQISPIKQENFGVLPPGGGGYGLAPIKQDSYNSAPVSTYGGGQNLKPIGGGGFNGGFKEPAGGFGGGQQVPFKEDFGIQQGGGGGYGAQAPIKKPYSGGGGGHQGGGHFMNGGYRQPSSLGYNSGSGIAFGNNGGYGSQGGHSGGHSAPGGGYGGQQQQYKQPINQGYGGSAPAQHQGGHIQDSYSKAPVIEPGYGTPLAPPSQKAPGGYGR